MKHVYFSFFVGIMLLILGATLGHTAMINQTGTASWYGDYHQGRLTADGERFNMHRLTAAHRSYPFGTILRVTNTKCGKSVLVKVNDRGPYHGNRILDMTKEAARRIDMLKTGTSNVKIHVVRYPKNKEPYHHRTVRKKHPHVRTKHHRHKPAIRKHKHHRGRHK